MASRFLIHDSNGLSLSKGPPSVTKDESYPHFEGKVKGFTSSANGKRIAWIADAEVKVVEAPTWKVIGSLKHPRAQDICFSPNGNYLAVWDTFAKVGGSTPAPNMAIYDVTKRKLLKSFFQQSQTNWKPQWTKDEALMARMVTSEVHFYKADELDKPTTKFTAAKLRSFSLTQSVEKHYCTFFVPGVKDQPALVKLYMYPHFSGLPIATRNVFKVDTVEAFWNEQCSSVLLLTTNEVERGASYYGQQMLFYMDIKGESNRVTFSKEATVRSVAWAKSGREFFCVYGAAPSQATLFNLKCDPVAEFGKDSRNLVMPNPVGNIVLIGGIGNIAARFEFWDISGKRLLGKQDCSDITHMEWSPCGQYLLTSTCSPRLRVNNGYKVWHYSAVLQHEYLFEKGELYQASWVPEPEAAKDFKINIRGIQGIETKVATASKQRYVPPSQRSKLEGQSTPRETTKFLSQHEEAEELDPKLKKKREKALEKKKKKQEEAAKKKAEEKGHDKDWRTEREPVNDKPRKAKTEDVDKAEKAKIGHANRIKNLEKKLAHIERVKALQAAGKPIKEIDAKKLEEENDVKKLLEKLSL